MDVHIRYNQSALHSHQIRKDIHLCTIPSSPRVPPPAGSKNSPHERSRDVHILLFTLRQPHKTLKELHPLFHVCDLVQLVHFVLTPLSHSSEVRVDCNVRFSGSHELELLICFAFEQGRGLDLACWHRTLVVWGPKGDSNRLKGKRMLQGGDRYYIVEYNVKIVRQALQKSPSLHRRAPIPDRLSDTPGRYMMLVVTPLGIHKAFVSAEICRIFGSIGIRERGLANRMSASLT